MILHQFSIREFEEDYSMTCKPIIGLNADYRAAARSTPAFGYIAAGYFDSIISAGGIPVIVPPMDDAESIHKVLDQVSGFMNRRRRFGSSQ